MVSPLHELLVRMLREHVEVLRVVLAPDLHLPESIEVRSLDPSVSPSTSSTVRAADLALELVGGELHVGIVGEVQLRIDEAKRAAFPLYLAHAAARLGVPCYLVVLTLDASVERWLEGWPAFRGSLGLRPIVIGPSRIPRIQDPAQEPASPELALLSLLAHARAEPEVAARIAEAFVRASANLDADRRTYYADVAGAVLQRLAPQLAEMIMRRPPNYEYQSTYMREAKAEGLREGRVEGRLEGLLQGEARVVERQLARRFGELPESVHARLGAASEEKLEAWAERLLFADSLEAVFADDAG